MAMMLTRFAPWSVLLLMALLNAAYFGTALLKARHGGGEEATAHVLDVPLYPIPPRPADLLTRSHPAPPPAKVVAEAPSPPPPPPVVKEKEPVKPAKPTAKVPEKRVEESKTGGILVQAGSFVLKAGADTLVEQLKKGGVESKIQVETETVSLNLVQAGPFENRSVAREMEAKLLAGGMDAKIEETWEGFLVAINKTLYLSQGVQDMDKARKLGVKPLRMVKVPEAHQMYKVVVGPFGNRTQAKETSEKLANMGISMPIIRGGQP
ncbi:MAG: SPOR domain-containing protein [Magnetococcales bacterium]|nr:SPOR domain-containing protein [Magnetococcales bacterium]